MMCLTMIKLLLTCNELHILDNWRNGSSSSNRPINNGRTQIEQQVYEQRASVFTQEDLHQNKNTRANIIKLKH